MAFRSINLHIQQQQQRAVHTQCSFNYLQETKRAQEKQKRKKRKIPSAPWDWLCKVKGEKKKTRVISLSGSRQRGFHFQFRPATTPTEANRSHKCCTEGANGKRIQIEAWLCGVWGGVARAKGVNISTIGAPVWPLILKGCPVTLVQGWIKCKEHIFLWESEIKYCLFWPVG